MPSASLAAVQKVGVGETASADIAVKARKKLGVAHNGGGIVSLYGGHGCLPSANTSSIV
jgi:hypothetical protein